MLRVLHVSPYRIIPPVGGGALRCCHLLQQLAKHCDVTAIVFQAFRPEHRQSLSQVDTLLSPQEIPPPRTIWDSLPAGKSLQFRWLKRSVAGPADAFLLKSWHLFEQALSHPADVVIFEHLQSTHAAPLVRRLCPEAVCLLDAHNVDHVLARQAVEQASPTDRAERQATYEHTLRLEQELGTVVDGFLACSDADRDLLHHCCGLPGYTVPNGVDAEQMLYAYQPVTTTAPRLLFCGSLGYPPNRDGLTWFEQEIWPRLQQARPDTQLTVIGRDGGTELCPALRADPHVNWVGEVPETLPYYRQAEIAICPLRMGSGTRLKILEAMSAGTPVVSTTIGAEGIDATDGQHLLLADDADAFVRQILSAADSAHLHQALSKAGRALVDTTYSWDVVGTGVHRILSQICAAQQ